MLEEMKTLVREKTTCVLATASENQPHCSLMAYVSDDDCREIYMVTRRESKKFRNLTKNPSVSLLIDTRGEDPGHQNPEARALTISGVVSSLNDDHKISKIKADMVSQHPHIQPLIEAPDSEIIRVKIVSFLLLKGPTEAYFKILE